MARRVYLSPTIIRVSRPGFDAATAAIQNLSFSSDDSGLAGSVMGQVYLPEGGTNDPKSESIVLPAGSGIPVAWVWNDNPNLWPSAMSFNQVLIYYNAAQTRLIFEARSPSLTYAGYLIYRNRS